MSDWRPYEPCLENGRAAMRERDLDLESVRKAIAGFNGRFEFDPAHTEDHGIGHVAETVDLDDRLQYVPYGFEARDDAAYTIADHIEQHVAEPLAEILNTAPLMLAEIDRLRAELDDLEQLRLKRSERE